MIKTLIKPSAVLGGIIGVLLGIILLIPFLNVLGFLAFMIIGTAVVCYLKHYSFIGILSIKDGAIIGATSGFCATITTSMIYIPFIMFKLFFFSTTAAISSNWSGTNMILSYFFLLAMLVITAIAPMVALFNALSGMAAAYVYNKKENIQIGEGQTEFIIDDTI